MTLPPATVVPCNDCPWRRVAIPGWLGPYTASRWLEIVFSDEPIACHQTIRKSGNWGGCLQCCGAAIFRANICKMPRDQEVAVGPSDRQTVFASPGEFLAHHGGENRG